MPAAPVGALLVWNEVPWFTCWLGNPQELSCSIENYWKQEVVWFGKSDQVCHWIGFRVREKFKHIQQSICRSDASSVTRAFVYPLIDADDDENLTVSKYICLRRLAPEFPFRLSPFKCHGIVNISSQAPVWCTTYLPGSLTILRVSFRHSWVFIHGNWLQFRVNYQTTLESSTRVNN